MRFFTIVFLIAQMQFLSMPFAMAEDFPLSCCSDIYQEPASEDPDSEDIDLYEIFAKAKALGEEEDYQAVIEELTRLAEEYPSNTDVLAQSYFMRGRSYFMIGEVEKGVADTVRLFEFKHISVKKILQLYEGALDYDASALLVMEMWVTGLREDNMALDELEVSRVYRLMDLLYDADRFEDLLFVVNTILANNYIGESGGLQTEGLRHVAVYYALVAEDNDSALSHLHHITSPLLRRNMYLSVSYKPMWDHISRGSLSDFSRWFDKLEAIWMADPSQDDTTLVFMNVLRHMNKAEQAISVAEANRDLRPADAVMDMDYMWILDEKALAYSDLGRFDEALQLYDTLLKDGLSEDRLYLVNIGISRALFLLWTERYEEALKAIQLDRLSEFSSDFGRAALRAVEVCSRHKLGQTEEAAAMMEMLFEDRSHRYETILDAALCLDNREQAEVILLEGVLNDTSDKILEHTSFYPYFHVRSPFTLELWKRRHALLGGEYIDIMIALSGRVDVHDEEEAAKP